MQGPKVESRNGVFLKAFTPEWSEQIREWRNHPDVFLWNGERDMIDSIRFQKELADMMERVNDAALVFRHGIEQPVGLIYAEGKSQTRNSCSMGVFVDEQYRQMRIAPAAFCLFARRIFFNYNVGKVKLQVAGWNSVSLATMFHAQDKGWLSHEGTEEKELLLGANYYSLFHFAMNRDQFDKLVTSTFWQRLIG